MLYDLTDWMIGPIKQALQAVVDMLSNASLVAARGINPTYYLGAYAWLPGPWLSLVKTAIVCACLLAVLMAALGLYRLYLSIKAGVKWW